MILLSLDFETTGLDFEKDDIIEVGAILYSTNQKKCLDNQGMLVKTDKPILPDITRLTGITQAAVNRFGYDKQIVLETLVDMLDSADAVIGYNVRRFDQRVFHNLAAKNNQGYPDKPWIDLYGDLPWQVPLGKLSHLAADHGILNLFPHSAMADCQTVLAVAEKYDFELLLARAKSPVVILRSHQARHENELVKQAPFKFRWNGNEKFWWKAVKQQDVDEIVKQAPFSISIEKDRTVEELDN